MQQRYEHNVVMSNSIKILDVILKMEKDGWEHYQTVPEYDVLEQIATVSNVYLHFKRPVQK